MHYNSSKSLLYNLIFVQNYFNADKMIHHGSLATKHMQNKTLNFQANARQNHKNISEHYTYYSMFI